MPHRLWLLLITIYRLFKLTTNLNVYYGSTLTPGIYIIMGFLKKISDVYSEQKNEFITLFLYYYFYLLLSQVLLVTVTVINVGL